MILKKNINCVNFNGKISVIY